MSDNTPSLVAEQCPHHEKPAPNTPSFGIPAKTVIREFLGKYRSLLEPRIQFLVFITDWYSVTNYGYRMTDTVYEPFDYGFWSPDISNALDSLSVGTTSIRRNGTRTTKYLGYWVTPDHESPLIDAVLSRVHELTRNHDRYGLARLVKESSLYEIRGEVDEGTFSELVDAVRDNIDSDSVTDYGSHDPMSWHETVCPCTNGIPPTIYDPDAPRISATS